MKCSAKLSTILNYSEETRNFFKKIRKDRPRFGAEMEIAINCNCSKISQDESKGYWIN
jgi:hypothetical protein